MDRKKLLQVLLPAGAAGGMVLLVGLLIALGDGGSTAATNQGQAGGENPFGKPPFPLDAPEWKPVGNAGLKVWDVKEGTGEPIPEGALPIMHYTGWKTNGTQFDTSKDDGQPLKLPLGRLIKGWQIGVPGMKPGGVRRLYVPYALGYGASGGQGIPPKTDLLFEMELLDWK
jgi:FKBP-type peptidyl-prolyl cis-trans isomerase FkpA